MIWKRVIDELPVIPADKYSVSVIIVTFDPCFHDVCREHGNFKAGYHVNRYATWTVLEGLSPDPDFYEMLSDDSWIPMSDAVTHWMYIPKPPELDAEVLNPIFERYHKNARPTPPLFVVKDGLVEIERAE